MTLTVKAVIFGAGRVSNTLLGMATMVLLARCLGSGDYATYRQATYLFQFLGTMMALGFPDAVLYFIPRAPDQRGKILAETLTTLAFLGGGFSAALMLGGAGLLAEMFQNPLLAEILTEYAIFPLLLLPTLAIPGALAACGRVVAASLFMLTNRALTFALVVGATWTSPNADAALQATTLALALSLGVGLTQILWLCGPLRFKLSLDHLRAMLVYAVPLGACCIVSSLILGLDKFLVASMCGTGEYALYVTGALELPLVAIVAQSLDAVLTPEVARLQQNNDTRTILRIWHEQIAKAARLLLPIFCFCMLFAEPIMVLLFTNRFAESGSTFRWYLALMLMGLPCWGTIFKGLGKQGVQLGCELAGLLVQVALTIICIAVLGPNGAAFALIATLALVVCPLYSLGLTRQLQCSFTNLLPWVALAKAFVVAALPLLLSLPIAWLGLSPLATLIVGGIVYGIVFVAVDLGIRYSRKTPPPSVEQLHSEPQQLSAA